MVFINKTAYNTMVKIKLIKISYKLSKQKLHFSFINIFSWKRFLHLMKITLSLNNSSTSSILSPVVSGAKINTNTQAEIFKSTKIKNT